MKISNYFAKEKMDDASFIQTYIEKLSDLTDEDICWANSDLEEDHEKVQSLLMEMVLSFYATDLVDAKTRAGGEIKIFGKPKQINEKKIAGGTIEQAK